MLSNKLTFSLTSLVFLLMFAFVATPVMADHGGPTVTITDAGTATAPSMRDAFMVKFTFSAGVTDFNASTGDATYRFVNEHSVPLGAADDISLSGLTGNALSADGRRYTVSVDLTAGAGVPTGAVAFYVNVPKGAAQGATATNELASKRFDLPPEIIDRTVAITAVKDTTDTSAADGQDYTITFTFKFKGPGTAPAILSPDPDPLNANIMVTPSVLKDDVVTGDPADGLTADDGIYTLTATLPVGVPSVVIGLNPSYIAGATAVTIPMPDVTLPAAAAMVSNFDATERTFRITVTLTGADPAIAAFSSADLTVTDSTMASVMITPMPERFTAASQTYVAILEYDGLAALPLTIKIAATKATAETATWMLAADGTVSVMADGITPTPGIDPPTPGIDPPTPGIDPPTPVTPMGGTANADATGTRGAITFMLAATALEAGDYIILHPTTAMNGINLATATNVSTTKVSDALWTNLEEFFRFGGGSIDLVGPAGSLDKDVVISEIMWAADATPLPGVVQTRSQWIELYVAADSTQVSKDSVAVVDAKAGAWTLNMTSGNPGAKAANTTDRMSNWGLGQWNVTSGSYGQNGSLGNLAGNGIPASSPIAFVSMYRNIVHVDLVKTDKNRADQLIAIPDGTRSGSWKEDEANRGSYQIGNRYATPGQDQIINIISADAADTVARDGVIFNEIANRSAAKHEWIELHNQKTGSVDIKKYVLSMVSAELVATDDTDAHAKKDVAIVTFADADEDIVIPGGGYLVIVNTDPADTHLAVGQNVADPNSSKQGVDTLYYVDADLDLPDTGKFFLILRTEVKAGSHEKIVDVAAGNGGYFGLVDDDPNYNTDAWPLRSVGAGAKDDLGMKDDKTWKLDTTKALFHGDSWIGDVGVTGLGVDRNKTTFNSGTPGYANDAVQAEYFDADSKAKFTGMISISEVMVDQTKRNLPQWIELYNNSSTQGININGWELKILNVNSADLDGRTSTTLKIDGDLIVAPNQTALIVSGSGRRSSDIPDTSVYNLYAKHRQKLEMNSQRDSILSIEGFYISLSDARDVVADSVGNIDSNAKTDDAPAWALPMSDDGRSSLLRRYTSSDADDGTTAAGWILASMTNLVPQTYYGDTDDIASPGHRQGSPLPVSLSSFRPLRDQATGDVVIRWITQSELNNAGFNILRSETKKGEYKVVNLKGIVAGHGTTSEQHVYEWKDTTAKPNVVYYYQIEDVSLDGKRTALATTRLKGHVSAAGKVTTTWGDLKNQ